MPLTAQKVAANRRTNAASALLFCDTQGGLAERAWADQLQRPAALWRDEGVKAIPASGALSAAIQNVPYTYKWNVSHQCCAQQEETI
jgi:hypothetical protein